MIDNRLAINFAIRAICVLTGMLVLDFNAYAIPVKWVYRADPRPYEEIFKNGFAALGTNIDIYRHLLGTTGAIGNRTDAFISTSSSAAVADRFARERLLQRYRGYYYVYRIRGTDNIYSASDTAYHLEALGRIEISADFYYVLVHELEYSALATISPSQIYSVDVYTINDGVVTLASSYSNPGYIVSSSTTHDGPYTGADDFTTQPRATLLVTGAIEGASNLTVADVQQNPTPTFANCSLF